MKNQTSKLENCLLLDGNVLVWQGQSLFSLSFRPKILRLLDLNHSCLVRLPSAKFLSPINHLLLLQVLRLSETKIIEQSSPIVT